MRAHPEDLRGAARDLLVSAGALDNDREALKRTLYGLQNLWRSPVAIWFLWEEGPRNVDRLTEIIDDFADIVFTLEDLARQLEQRLQQIHHIERQTHAWFARQTAPTDGAEPIWIRDWWRYRPGRLPAPSDSEWLDVRPYLRARGAWV